MKFAAVATALLLSASLAQAASSGTLSISGTVATVFDLTVTATTPANSTLDILGGETNKKVADVSETSNNSAGYKITMSSLNNGLLKNGSIDSVGYQVSYNGGGNVTPSSSAATVKTSGTLSALTTATSTVRVTFTGKPTALAGTYSDTLTFVIAAP